jgi:release factor glutamine methyltransferase
MTTIGELVKSASQRLEAAGIDEPCANSEFAAAFVLNKKRTFIKAFGQTPVCAREEKKFNDIISRKIKGEPLAYIIGDAEFMGRVFAVNPDVLIPRPETEELILNSVNFLESAPKTILDLCAGSGCIAVSLSFIYPHAQITAADICERTLKVAQGNAKAHKSRVKFVKSDLFDAIDEQFDFIISNPPYIPSQDIESLAPQVKLEPRAALDGGAHGLEIIKRIIRAAPRYLNAGGLLALETGINEPEKVVKLFKEGVWSRPIIVKDNAGIDRFVFSRKIYG